MTTKHKATYSDRMTSIFRASTLSCLIINIFGLCVAIYGTSINSIDLVFVGLIILVSSGFTGFIIWLRFENA